MQDSNEGQSARLDAELDRLLDLPPEQRDYALHHDYGGEPELRAELESLLHSAAAMGGFLAQPAQPTSDQTTLDPSTSALRLGPWQLVRPIGSGGMGEVFEARRSDGSFEQHAAVKLLQAGAVGQHERFDAERRILARLEHPGISRLLDGGVTGDGRPWMAMELVAGAPITSHCAQTRATLIERLRLFEQVCDAVAYAHRHLVVHRDLKPANILVDADGRVRLLDFGIAKLLDQDAAVLTQTASILLTPAYSAPEQIAGGPITTAADVYALGLLLFELLAGCRPWPDAGSSLAQTVRAVLDRPVPTLSAVAASNPGAPFPPSVLRGDLDAVIAKALRKEPAQRYATVDAFKLDVSRVLRGEPVAAREGAHLYRVGHFLRRHRWSLAAVAALFVSLAVGLAATAWQARRAEVQRAAAAWQAHRAELQRDVARRDLAREEALRYELTNMFRKVLAQNGEHPLDAKGMLDASTQHLLSAYRDRPKLAGPLVLTLADLYDALEDAQGGAVLLEGYLTQAGTDADPGSVADARAKLANLELLRGDVDRAGKLLDQAQAYWAQTPNRYDEERLEGLAVRARLQRSRGDLGGAIATEQEAIRQRIALSGRVHRETAILYNSHAITLTAANRLEEALAAYHETSAIYRALGLGDGLDAQIILGNTGTLELRTGHLREAEPLLKRAYERERALAGDSAAVAAAMGYYGKVLTLTNRGPQAVATLREAATLGARYAGESSPLALQNRLFLGEAQLGTGDTAGARATLNAVRDAAFKQYGKSHALTLRAALALARVDMAEGHANAARIQLVQTVTALRRLGPAAEANLSEALVALGETDLSRGRPRAARAPLAEAVALREKNGPQSWDLAEARERLGEALAALGEAGARALLQQAQSTLAIQLGANHPLALRAQRALQAMGT
ncbi:MAG TPA: serine/threonine-protein kinase [Steroidobacteraceae bacterium]|nr:serine/threonine-protein kinase [Steroidobacteraceae bacterium]